MALTMTTGSPVRDAATIAAMAKKIAVENPVEYAPGATRTGQVQNREFPMVGIMFELKVEIANADGDEVISPFGLLNLIRGFKIAVDGTDSRFDVAGKNLPFIHHIYRGQQPHSDFNPAANGTYYAHFYVPLDIGGYQSLLDVSQNTSLDIRVDWGVRNDACTAGSATIESAELGFEVDYVTGAAAGQRGGKGFPYLANFIQTATIDIDSTRPDQLLEKLTSERGYHGATLFSYDNGARSDGVVNAVELVRADSQHLKEQWRRMRARDMDRFKLANSDAFKGVLHVPFVDPGHMEHTLSVRVDQAMRLIADVTKTANPCRVELVTHFFKNTR